MGLRGSFLLLISVLVLSSSGWLLLIPCGAIRSDEEQHHHHHHHHLYGAGAAHNYPSASHGGMYGEESLMMDEPLFRSMEAAEEQSDDDVDGADRVIIGASEVKRRGEVLVNVEDFGARDGEDATKAFGRAWSKVCASTAETSIMEVPQDNNYLLKPITFSGPCKSNVIVMVKGTLEAPSDRTYWSGTGKKSKKWIMFDGIDGLYVGGGGTINGNGQVWWEHSCKVDKSQPCKDAPTALTIHSSKNVLVENLKVKDSQQIHFEIEKCTNVIASNLTVVAPEKSPNTDGIHITHSRNVVVDSCVIGTGDDCISIVSGSHNINATNIVCGPGHGISIGSLGAHKSEAEVSDVTVDTAELKGTSNGVRIKTWQGGSGYAKNIKFQNINMVNVKNPIIIDENYCDSSKPCKEQKSAVQVSDVHYQNITGTSASEVAIKFQCSKSTPCRGIVLQDINLVRTNGKAAECSCANVDLTEIGDVVPPPPA